MSKMVTLTIDGKTVSVPEGTLIVDAAKKTGVDIPVFCYHPKLQPVGMCRMCLVDIGRPVIDRASGQAVLEADGTPKIQFGPKLETACTTPVSEGMAVICSSDKVKAGRKDILEFLLTSHPLDCPVCDKGGECPLQNLTLQHGPAASRFDFDEKMRLGKHIPLGDLIYLDRERCIQCGRCVRFQHEIAGDPVLGFYQRGRKLQIMTCSEPGFDSIFSGNTTDICPVGALTTDDFRFGARPWELNLSASLCSHCPVGCNITFNVRREAKTGGEVVIKRAMPRQNEWVNETWICDKGRFAYHFTESKERITRPLVRKGGSLVLATWEEALAQAATKFKAAGKDMISLVGGRLSNEDLFNIKQVTDGAGGTAALYTPMGGGDLVAQVGAGEGTNFKDMGKGSAILVIASDLHEEAPIWWLRVKQAAERGATLIAANPRPTRLDRYATHIIRYEYGSEAATIQSMMPGGSPSKELKAAAEAFAAAENGIIIFGSEGQDLGASKSLALACAHLLNATNHVGKANNGLIGVWPGANTQGAWDMGFQPLDALNDAVKKAKAVYIAAADPAGDDPAFAAALREARFIVVQELFMTETARMADVVLPVLAYTEREGTYTSGERRVQRFYQAVTPQGDVRPDYQIGAQIGKQMGLSMEDRAPSLVMLKIAATYADYAEVTYQKLSEVVEQEPIIGREDLYYGGTAYDNQQGLGYQLAPAAQTGKVKLPALSKQKATGHKAGEIIAIPVTHLYDQGYTVSPSILLQKHLTRPEIILNPADARKAGLADEGRVEVNFNNNTLDVTLRLDENVPAGYALAPHHAGIPIIAPAAVQLKKIDK